LQLRVRLGLRVDVGEQFVDLVLPTERLPDDAHGVAPGRRSRPARLLLDVFGHVAEIVPDPVSDRPLVVCRSGSGTCAGQCSGSGLRLRSCA